MEDKVVSFLNLSHQQWLDYIIERVTCDFETGELFWKKAPRGRYAGSKLGGFDSNGYIKLQIGNKSTYAHRVVYFLYHGKWPDFMLDHKNQVRNDNRPDNLRPSNASENALNSKMWNTNSSGVKGVSITRFGTFKTNKSGKHLGTFKTLQEAEDAYNKN